MTTTLSLSNESASSHETDAIVIGFLGGPDGPRPAPGAESVDSAFDGRLSAALTALGATGAAEEVVKIVAPAALPAPVVVAVGLGEEPGAYEPETLRRAAGAALRSLLGARRVAVGLPARSEEEIEAVALGAMLGNYSFLRYRSGKPRPGPVAEVTVLSAQAADRVADRIGVLNEAVTLVRDLVNTAPSDLCPADFAEVARSVAADTGLTVEVLDEEGLADGGYGGILGVGQGSVRGPRLVRLSYEHPGATTTVVLCGKGITFDSGGLSLKPTDAMDWMKSDMGGAAAVLGALQAVARLRPVIRVVGYLALAENMPSGTAQRPSDVLTIYGGKTVEVLNTDAEGRLVLADVLARSGEDAPALVVDVATLTGAQMVALGTRTSGVMANDDGVRDGVIAAARRAGESMWPMPLPPELRKNLESGVADISNVGPDRWGGMLVAGVFLAEFVPDGVRWAHLDIAGPAFNKGDAYGYTPKGGTGAAVRTLVQIVEDVAAGLL